MSGSPCGGRGGKQHQDTSNITKIETDVNSKTSDYFMSVFSLWVSCLQATRAGPRVIYGHGPPCSSLTMLILLTQRGLVLRHTGREGDRKWGQWVVGGAQLFNFWDAAFKVSPLQTALPEIIRKLRPLFWIHVTAHAGAHVDTHAKRDRWGNGWRKGWVREWGGRVVNLC